MSFVINIDECLSCGQCIDACKVHGITIVQTHGYARFVINDNCKGCGSCKKVCPGECISEQR